MKPILFNTEMVRAILEGKKTVTRRAVKFPRGWNPKFTGYIPDGAVLYGSNNIPAAKSPYKTGDILWVREIWSPVYVRPRRYIYKADVDRGVGEGVGLPLRWHHPNKMPREAARIFLRVTDVRVERLQDINLDPTGPENQVIKEGLRYLCDFIAVWQNTLKRTDWPVYGWDANPWVWVIEFERTEGGMIVDKKKEFEQYPCKHRDEDGLCAKCAWMCECGMPCMCAVREAGEK